MSEQDVLRLVGALISGGETLEFAWKTARASYSDDDVEAAKASLAEWQADILELTEPVVIQRPHVIEPWRKVPLPGDIIWPATRSALIADGFPPAAMEGEIEPAATLILNHLPPPGTQGLQSRGLVLGFVQSGKTTSYTSLIAMAADAGYRIVVVLAGIHDALREQTQERLNRHLVDAAGGGQWMNLTHDGDFSSPLPLAQALTPAGARALAVVKKNPHRLRRLLKWFSEAPEILLERRPILLVDDEADQASINVGSGRRSTINRLILQILDRPKAAYVAYTATPFANMLIDPSDDDLYPDDFIAALPRPADYFGPETLFGRQPLTEDEAAEDFDGLGIVCHVDDQDAAQVRPPRRRADRGSWSPSVPKSLRQAIIWFVLATAARRTRGPAEHSSMLVHTTMYTDAHEALGEAVRTDVRALLRGWEEADKGIFHEISVVWRDLVRPDLTTQFSLPGLNYEEVRGRISEVLAETEVVVDNYRSEQRLSYPDDRHVTVIAIGGNTLSRGLTLEGLVVSYFVRAASAYDTLMQMGRWFGFRRGYADLPRVWLTPDLEDFFIRLATVEAEVRADVERYRLEQKTPRDFAVRIRTIPGLAVTSRAKMRSHKKLHVSYANQRKQTFLFDHRNLETLEANLDAARTLIHEAGEANTVFRKREGRPGWWLARDVPWAHLRGFLAAYRFHPEQADLNADAIIRFVEKQTDLGGITTWNVAVAGLEGAPNGSLPLGLPDEIGLLIRAKLNIPGLPHANIKSLMTTIDRVIDLPDRDDEAKDIMAGVDGGEGRRETRLAGLRPEGVGLVVIYPIQAESAPRELSKIKRKSPRTRLDAATDVIGVGLVFPRCTGTDHEAVEYVVAFDEPLDMEDADELSEEEAQLADARDAEALAREDEEAGGSER